MLTAKQQLITQTAQAFRGRRDMPMMGCLDAISQEEASWQPDKMSPSAEQIVRHVAWAKSRYCQQGFGTPMVVVDPTVNDDGDSPRCPWEFPCGAEWGAEAAPGIAGAIGLLEKAHVVLTGCLEACAEESLELPIPNHHGRSAAHFFWIMIMHDLYHAGQIRTRRTMFKSVSK